VQLRVEADLAKAKYEVDTNATLKREEMANTLAIAKINAAAKPKPTPVAKKKVTKKKVSKKKGASKP
jgi:hypothetical protein